MSNLLEKASILLTPTAYDDGKILSVKPIDGSGDFQFTRNSSATRVNSQGLIEDMQTFSGNLVSNGDFSQEGPELITNGDFSTDSDWTLTQATISNGKATLSTPDGSYAAVREFNALVIGKTYLFTIDVDSISSGSITVGNSSLNINSSGIYSGYYVSSSTTAEIKRNTFGSATNAVINSISVKEVGQDWDFYGEAELTAQGARIYSSSGSYSALNQVNVLTIGNKYKITFNVISTNGTNLANNNSTITYDTSTTGNKTFYITASESALEFKRAAAITTDVTISNISVIEITDDTNLPRIDYSPYSGAGTCGHWLFEPQSTQTATYSNDFTQGDIFVSSADPSLSAIVLTSQQATSPDGTNNAWKMVDNNNGATGTTGFNYFSANLIANNYNTISFFVKKQGSNNFVYINTGSFDAGAIGKTYFDIQNGTLGDVFAGHTANIENYGNGWYRISITMQTVTDIQGAFSLRLATSNGAQSILRDGTNGVYFFGVQAESDASRQFMTSYIPTSGSTVTRNQEAAFGAGNSSLINSTEGVLYAEISPFPQDGRIALNDGTNSNNVRFTYQASNNTISGILFNGSNQAVLTYQLPTENSFYKIAFKYKASDFSLYFNGVEVDSLTSGGTTHASGTLSQLDFDAGNGLVPFYGNVRSVAVFKEALTDDELECLTSDETSFSSFNALALANNYTII